MTKVCEVILHGVRRRVLGWLWTSATQRERDAVISAVVRRSPNSISSGAMLAPKDEAARSADAPRAGSADPLRAREPSRTARWPSMCNMTQITLTVIHPHGAQARCRRAMTDVFGAVVMHGVRRRMLGWLRTSAYRPSGHRGVYEFIDGFIYECMNLYTVDLYVNVYV